ncbi:sodium-dependent dopamine transporter-like isoform X2 [Ornithodoros turicata]|uniref:sodium-dependent dopamine transporter-like isoform X2 n=1 Tax=Ornithodoros turicata TaxID=34597 RepID=UPI003138C1FE
MVELDRLRWSEKTDFFTICLVSCISLGNLFQFPLSVYKQGTGAFLLVYVFTMVVAGTPLFLLEAQLGQFSSCGPLHVFSCFPMARGLGLSMLLVAFVRAVLGSVLLAQLVLYCYSSFQSRIPWMDCDTAWGADIETCFVRSTGIKLCSAGRETILQNYTSAKASFGVPLLIDNVTYIISQEAFMTQMHGCLEAEESSPRQFYFRRILALSKDISGITEFSYDLLIAYAIIWSLVFLSVIKIRFCARVWHRAVSSMLTSLGIGTGSVFVFASFNEINTPAVRRDVVYIVILDLLTSLLGSCLLFLVMGNLSYTSHVPLDTFFSGEGASLLFIMSSEVLGALEYPQLWSVIFYFTILYIGITHMMAGMLTVITCVTDEILVLRRAGHFVTLVFCVFGFVAGLPLCSAAGYHVYQLVSRFAVEMPVLILACFEVVALTWGYGIDRLLFDIAFMDRSTTELRAYWVFCWKYISPITLLTALGGTVPAFQKHTEELFQLNVIFTLVGAGLLLASLVWLPVYLFAWLLENGFDVTMSLLPCSHWGPREPQQFRAYHEALKNSDLAAQKRVYRTDRKETVAERFTLYLVHHSPKYMGRFIKKRGETVQEAPKVVRAQPNYFPCE